MKWMHVFAALVTLLALTLGPAVAQMGRPGMESAPDEPMARMMAMMEKMRADMQHMREQMGGMPGMGMQGMGPMQERMGRMMTMMGQTQAMMEQHRERMRSQCPAFQSPTPGPGG